MARTPAKVLRSERFASKRRAVRRDRRRRRRRVTVTLVALTLLGVGGFMLARSSLFALDGIDVVGTRLLSRSEILRVSGLHVGDNMLSLDTHAVEARVARLPLVGSVTVSKPGPSRVRILVTERSAAFVLETPEDRWFLDPGAVLLDRAGAASETLPTIRLEDAVPADTGDRIRSGLIHDAMTLWSALPFSLRKDAPTLEALPSDMILEGATLRIRFGTLDRLSEKLGAIRLVVERARKAHDHLVAVDVRAPSRPAAQLA